jgi:hypothetical protein
LDEDRQNIIQLFDDANIQKDDDSDDGIISNDNINAPKLEGGFLNLLDEEKEEFPKIDSDDSNNILKDENKEAE